MGQSPNNSVSMLGQRRIRFTGIEPAMGCDAGPTLNGIDRIAAYTDLSALVVE